MDLIFLHTGKVKTSSCRFWRKVRPYFVKERWGFFRKPDVYTPNFSLVQANLPRSSAISPYNFDTSVLLHHDDGGYRAEPGRADYLEEHITGAGFINLCEDWSDTASGFSNTLPSSMRLVQLLAKMELAMTIWLFCILLVILWGHEGLVALRYAVTTMCVF